MRKEAVIGLFLDIGNVLLTNGWDHEMGTGKENKGDTRDL
jgi:hypothetical protein